MDGDTCICPIRVLDDWAEALELAAAWDAAAARAADVADEPSPTDHPPGPPDR